MKTPGHERRQKAAGEDAADGGDAEVERRPCRQHHILQAVRDRRDKGQRGDRRRIEIIGAKIAGRIPARGHQQTDRDARRDLPKGALKRRVRERKNDQGSRYQRGGERPRECLGEA